MQEEVLPGGKPRQSLDILCRKHPAVNQLVAVRLKEILADVLSVIKIPTFQILILQVWKHLLAVTVVG